MPLTLTFETLDPIAMDYLLCLLPLITGVYPAQYFQSVHREFEALTTDQSSETWMQNMNNDRGEAQWLHNYLSRPCESK